MSLGLGLYLCCFRERLAYIRTWLQQLVIEVENQANFLLSSLHSGPQLTPTSSSRVQLVLQTQWFRYKYTCMYECRYDYKCTDSAKYRCNCTRRHYWLHCLVPVLGLDWCPIEPDFTYHTLQHMHDSSIGLRMFLGVI